MVLETKYIKKRNKIKNEKNEKLILYLLYNKRMWYTFEINV